MPDVELPMPFEAYTGAEPYVFVSYAHVDAALVYPELEYLHARGYRVWYDEGIDPGNEWPEAVAKALDGCAHFLVFLTPRAVQSRNVRNEINYAVTEDKPFLAVHLGETSLIPGMKLQIGALQAIMRYRMTEEGFHRKLCATLPASLIGPPPDDPPPTARTPVPEVVVPTPHAVLSPDDGPPADARLGDIWVNRRDGAELVYVPAGEFTMGSDDGPDDEKPQRIVYLDGCWMYKHEVTVAQYREFCSATRRQMPNAPSWGWKEDHPVVNVTWGDAHAYADWAGVALPTEAQWEKAARGTDGRAYPWGDVWDATKCVCSVGGRRKSTAPVGSIPAGASPYGCLDMAGNVWDWCADWYEPRYYAKAPNRNPNGPATGSARCVRGGSWNYDRTGPFRCAYRDYYYPDYRLDHHGFRCARTVQLRLAA